MAAVRAEGFFFFFDVVFGRCDAEAELVCFSYFVMSLFLCLLPLCQSRSLL